MFRHIGTGMVIFVLIAAIGYVLSDATPQIAELNVGLRVAIATLLLTLLALWVLPIIDYRRIFNQSEKRNRRLNKGFLAPTVDEIMFEQTAMLRTYSDETIDLFYRMMLDPRSYLLRIKEAVEIDEMRLSLTISTYQQYRIGSERPKNGSGEDVLTYQQSSSGDGESPETILVPVAKLEKGTLLDDFKVVDSNGGIVPTLPYTKFRGLILTTLEFLVQLALQERGRNLDTIERRFIRRLVTVICGYARSDGITLRRKVVTLIEGLVSDLDVGERWKSDIRNFCIDYLDNYAIIAEVDSSCVSGCGLALTYSHKIPSQNNSKKRNWRGMFGLEPEIFDLSLNPQIFQVETYHFQMAAPTGGQYVVDHHLEEIGSRKRVTSKTFDKRSWPTGRRPYIRIYDDDARPSAHLYVRQQGVVHTDTFKKATGESKVATTSSNFQRPPILKSVVEFREVPPGARGAATIVALASAAIITFFALTHIGMTIPDPDTLDSNELSVAQVSATLNSDVPALLLALPAFVSVLIGSWLDLARLRHTSLTTYLALMGTLFLSLGSALFFLFDANRPLLTETSVPMVFGLSITSDWVWLSLMGVAITHFLFLFRMVAQEYRTYARKVRGRIDYLTRVRDNA